MSAIKLNKHKIFKKTDNVLFYDISIKESNASDLVIHESAAISPPNDELGNKQFYIHSHQIDNNRVISGSRTFELINFIAALFMTLMLLFSGQIKCVFPK